MTKDNSKLLKKMGILSLSSLLILVVASLGQTNAVFGNPTTATTTQKTMTTTEFPSSPEPPMEVLTCPLDSTISPCTCYFFLNTNPDIKCSGAAVNQTSIENALKETRQVNGIPEDRGIHINEFVITFTELTELDLAPFYGSKLEYLYILNNYNLTKFVTSKNPGDHGSIQVNYFQVSWSPLSRSGFGDALKYFSNQMIDFTAFDLNVIDADYSEENDGEFLPGLSAHTNLTRLHISDRNISGRLNSDTLIPKELQNLVVIDLQYNSINEIGENAFDFEGSQDYLIINLESNNLNETLFHPNSGIARPGRITHLYLYKNQIPTLPFEIFEPFLDAHPQNSLGIIDNPLICDERLSWLKSRREEFESRVDRAYCSNDQGYTVFESDLIP